MGKKNYFDRTDATSGKHSVIAAIIADEYGFSQSKKDNKRFRKDLREIKHDLSHSNLEGTVFSGADLTNMSFRGAKLQNTDFSSAVFDFVDVSNADLRGANLRNVNLETADLTNTDLRGAKNISTAVINASKIRGVKVLESQLVSLAVAAGLFKRSEDASLKEVARRLRSKGVEIHKETP